jgi:hypothetical protein
VQATPDGRFLVFESVADLTPGDTSSVPQVFEYDALREKLVRVSIGAAGYAAGNANADANQSFIPDQGSTESSAPTEASTGLAVSADGSRVLFESGGALTEGAQKEAAAGAPSVYEYRSTGAIENGDVYLISDGADALESNMIGLDASGDDAFFATGEALVPTDVDTNKDFYDARLGGGFPVPVAPAGCEGEACQGTPSVAPSFGAPGSLASAGGGNLPVPAQEAGSPPKPKPKPRVKHAKHRASHTGGARKRAGHGKKANVYVKGYR